MIVEINDLSFRYGDVQALQDVSLDISAGERVALTGHNGSGKSTLVRQLNGLLRPSTGTIRIAGNDIANTETGLLAGQVALLFQNPDDQICKSTVWKEVVFGPENLKYEPMRRTSIAEEALEFFALTPFRDANPHDLGYSERKRVAMASIVAMDTPVLVFDEPTAGLDPWEVSLLVRTLETLRRRQKTVIVITHDMDFVAENIDRVITLSRGKKVFDGTVRELFSQIKLINDSGLLLPEVVQLSTQFSLARTPLCADECALELEEGMRLPV